MSRTVAICCARTGQRFRDAYARLERGGLHGKGPVGLALRG
jgi:hypothetical protein